MMLYMLSFFFLLATSSCSRCAPAPSGSGSGSMGSAVATAIGAGASGFSGADDLKSFKVENTNAESGGGSAGTNPDLTLANTGAGNTEINDTAAGDTGVGSTGVGTPDGGAGGGAGNPFAGYNVLVDPLFEAGAGAQSCALKPSFSWVEDAGTAAKIAGYVQTAKRSGPNYIVPLAIYAIPNRDCGAGASAGGASGIGEYQTLIDQIKSLIDPTVRTVIVLEPDALAQLISNQCGGSTAQTYTAGITYALKTLNAENVFIYVDGGNGDWLGSPDKIQTLTTMLLSIWNQAGNPKSLKGISTNVSNFRPWSAGGSPSISKRSMADESSYVSAVGGAFSKAGLPAHFIVDTSRNGKAIDIAPGFPCNLKAAGLGVPYTTETGDPAVDAFIWIKTPGQSDGSGSTPACALPQAQQGAPAAGTWFPALFQSQMQNAVPSAVQCDKVTQPATAATQKNRRRKKRWCSYGSCVD